MDVSQVQFGFNLEILLNLFLCSSLHCELQTLDCECEVVVWQVPQSPIYEVRHYQP